MKKYLFGLLAVTLAVGFSAFTKAHKPPTPVAYFYKDTKLYQRIEANDNNIQNYKKSMNLDPNYNTASAAVRQLANWSTNSADCSAATYDAIANDGTRYLKSFNIPNEDATSNGTSATDDAVSFQEVVAELQRSHAVDNAGAALPASIQVGSPGFKVTVPITVGESFH